MMVFQVFSLGQKASYGSNPGVWIGCRQEEKPCPLDYPPHILLDTFLLSC